MTKRSVLIASAVVVLCVCCVIWCRCYWCCERSVTTFLIVRHADRAGSADALSPAGVTRAQELVHVATKAGVTAIYCSDTNRSQQTAQPLATALGVSPIVLPAASPADWVEHAFKTHRGHTVLMVGHSNTVPRIIAAAGGPTIPDVAGDEFDDFFVLQTPGCLCSRSKLLDLQYGVATP